MSPERLCVLMTAVMNTPRVDLEAGRQAEAAAGLDGQLSLGLPADYVAALHRCLSSQCGTGTRVSRPFSHPVSFRKQ